MAEAIAVEKLRPAESARFRVLPDRRLLKLAAAGSRGAFAEIFRRHHQALYLYAKSILRDDQDAYDAVQTTMVKLLDSLPGEQREIALKPWLFRIAHNESISIIRGRQDASSNPEEEAAPARDDAELRMRTEQLLADLGALPERQRSAVVLRELSGLAHKEIGVALGVSAAAAKQAVYEGRLALQQAEEGREMECSSAREAISARDRRLLRGRRIRAHLRACVECRSFADAIEQRQAGFAALTPLPLAGSQQLLESILGSGGGGAGGMGLLGGIGVAEGAKALTGGVAAQFAAAVVVATGAGVAVTAGGEGGGEPDRAGTTVAGSLMPASNTLPASISHGGGGKVTLAEKLGLDQAGESIAKSGAGLSGSWVAPQGSDEEAAGAGGPDGTQLVDVPSAPSIVPGAQPGSPGSPTVTGPVGSGPGGQGGGAGGGPGAGSGPPAGSPPGGGKPEGTGNKPDSPPGQGGSPGNKPGSPPGQGGSPGNKPASPPGQGGSPGNKPGSPPGQGGSPGNPSPPGNPPAPPGKPENPGNPSPPGNPPAPPGKPEDLGKPVPVEVPKPDNPGKGLGKP